MIKALLRVLLRFLAEPKPMERRCWNCGVVAEPCRDGVAGGWCLSCGVCDNAAPEPMDAQTAFANSFLGRAHYHDGHHRRDKP